VVRPPGDHRPGCMPRCRSTSATWGRGVHPGRRRPVAGVTYREAAAELPEYLHDLASPTSSSCRSRSTRSPAPGIPGDGVLRASAVHGTPDDFRYLGRPAAPGRDRGAVDWVPGHFPKDDWALAHSTAPRCTSTTTPDWANTRMGHPDLQLRAARGQELPARHALYWIEEFHLDGYVSDAVASMLYLDYARKEGEWVTNRFGGRENLEAVDFIKQANELVYRHAPVGHARRRGIHRLAGRCPDPPIWAASVSGSNGTWGG